MAQASAPAISFIVPVYNAGGYLSACLESLLAQGCPNYEIILIDDGSTDGSAAVCDSFAAKDPRIRVHHQQNAGVSATRNSGIECARGEWLCFVDADDTVAPGYAGLVKQYGTSGRDIVLFNYAELFPDKIVGHKSSGGVVELDSAAITDARRATLNRYHKGVLNYLQVHMTGPWLKAYRRTAVLSAGLRFPPGIISGEDTYFNFCFLAHARAGVFVPEIVYYYRQTPASATQRYNPMLMANFLRVNELYQKLFAADPALKQQFLADYSLYLTSCCMFIALQDCCHPDNPLPRRARKAAFTYLVAQSCFGSALHTAKLSQFSAAKAAVCLLMRWRLFTPLSLLNRIAAAKSAPRKPERKISI